MSPRILVQSAAFDTGSEIAALLAGRTDIGGVGCFIGTVRGAVGTRGIEAMTLEHYPGMTERALASIAAKAADRWPLQSVTIIHRIGRLLPGEPIVLVLTASAHRQAALDSTAFLIDWLKTAAPFWKQEHFSDGETVWVAAKTDDDQAAARWAQQ
ncbi:MAG: molybdenum cofactor biosynthesis protein MoaE [Janthinobacterium lividum]